MSRTPALSLCLLVPALALAQAQQRVVPAVIGFYNIENLFDTIDQPEVQDEEFLPNGLNQWTGERYMKKLHNMAHVIAELATDIHPRGPALLGLAEVENRSVVEDLVHTAPLAERGWKVVSHEGPDRRGVDVAFVYDPQQFTMLSQKGYRLVAPDDTSFHTRDQLLVTGILDGDTIHAIVAHWPSRRGGEKRSRPLRNLAADLGRHIVDSLMARNPNARVFYMGDLNDDPINESVRKHMKAVGDKSAATGALLYGPMDKLYKDGIGTLAWRDSWNLFDQIIMTPAVCTGAGGRYSYHGVHIHNKPYMRQQDGNFAGYPFRTFVGNQFMNGYSDHFPVYVVLTRPE
ncbi:MAG: endonuclease/exonuclease/phosphatase family protein [Flavobacteriales bacterium]|nr:endonuclease/exonuclease/phosphatase family protein [Flavobacteriales bacterium]MBK7553056.1 endonuclease/exonuclease/phosphatase family protein [Flavobacteriales bacterium]MBK9195945.1 endonuclease/exonuclease/phosphatase family protein [Flavobacteriales bacterium]